MRVILVLDTPIYGADALLGKAIGILHRDGTTVYLIGRLEADMGLHQ